MAHKLREEILTFMASLINDCYDNLPYNVKYAPKRLKVDLKYLTRSMTEKIKQSPEDNQVDIVLESIAKVVAARCPNKE